MNCTCVRDLELKLPAFAKAGDGATATCEATALGITDDMGVVMRLTLPFRIHGSVKPYKKAKGHVVPFSASFCPFCGRSARDGAYRVGHDDGIAAAFAAKVANKPTGEGA